MSDANSGNCETRSGRTLVGEVLVSVSLQTKIGSLLLRKRDNCLHTMRPYACREYHHWTYEDAKPHECFEQYARIFVQIFREGSEPWTTPRRTDITDVARVESPSARVDGHNNVFVRTEMHVQSDMAI